MRYRQQNDSLVQGRTLMRKHEEVAHLIRVVSELTHRIQDRVTGMQAAPYLQGAAIIQSLRALTLTRKREKLPIS